MIKKRQEAGVIQRHRPKLSSWFKSFFRKKPQRRFESALYRMGQRGKSIFWYWEIDYESHHYREFRTTNLVEGEKILRDEDFDSWPALEDDVES